MSRASPVAAGEGLLQLDVDELLRGLESRLDDPSFRAGVTNLAGDPFFVAFFLASVSQGEGLGEVAVGVIGQNDLARRIEDLASQQTEERGHKERTLDLARALFPEYFVEGQYRFADSMMGRPYYVKVLEANRARLKEKGRYSRLGLYLTTTFGYEIMVILLYQSVADAISRSDLPEEIRRRVARVLQGILAEEEAHLRIGERHQGLLDTPRAGLSEDAGRMLDSLASLEAEDYVFSAELAVVQVIDMMSAFEDAERCRAGIEAGLDS